jgi:drug/metabolite transporter (DMT)-like permease
LNTGSGLGAILLWSATFAFARSLSEQVGPLTAGAAVYLVGGCFCLLRPGWSAKPVSRLLKLPRPYLLGCGSLFVVYTAAIWTGCLLLVAGSLVTWRSVSERPGPSNQ